MNVRELIDALRLMPDDAPVKLEDWNEDYADPTELEVVTQQQDGSVLLGVVPFQAAENPRPLPEA